MRGPPSVARTTSDEGQRQCCLDNGTSKASGPMKKYGGWAQNRRSGAPGGARAGHTARGTARCRLEKVRLSALRSPRVCEGKREGRRPPRLTTNRGDESRLFAA